MEEGVSQMEEKKHQDSPTPQAGDTIFEQLLAINSEAFGGQSYETAYHALATAFHRALDLQTLSFMRQVERIARDQLHEIDTLAPSHRLSSQSAHMHRAQSVFQLLADQAATRTRLIQFQQTKQPKKKE